MDFVRLAGQDRQILDSYGFRRTAIQLTEWNYGLVDNPTDIQRAAFVADSLIYMQDAPLQRAFYYRANGGNGFALINSDGTFTKPGDAYEAIGSLNSTPLRLATTGGDDERLGGGSRPVASERGDIRVAYL